MKVICKNSTRRRSGGYENYSDRTEWYVHPIRSINLVYLYVWSLNYLISLHSHSDTLYLVVPYPYHRARPCDNQELSS
jgi:hypothetical protein